MEDTADGLPVWLIPADNNERDALLTVIAAWAQWYRSEVSPLPGGDDAWVGARFEYRFRVGAGEIVLNAPAHNGGDIDWHTFDAAPDLTLPNEDDEPSARPAQRQTHVLIASPLRYSGMPVDRLWEMEDAKIHLGVVESDPWDLAGLLVAEFALTYGNDWLVVPIDVPFGSLATVESVIYTTTFGERYVVKPTAAVSADGHWRMYTITAPDGSAIDGLLVPPSAVAVQDGEAIEEVLFLRDEMANMVWAVERNVQGPTGAAFSRAYERDQPNTSAGPVQTAAMDYRLQPGIPARWIPYLPMSKGYRAIELVQAAMPDQHGNPVRPVSMILQRNDVKMIDDAEVPREGVIVRRQPAVARRSDGAYIRWTTRRVAIGRGEGASKLSFDSTLSRRARPNA
ncbi:MAG: hypothetical protein EOO27_34460 [Comamonadaceae bacterium]|nr:MAG: hypothetical protein EOO27_34460 [Comamonadaceae bacterium]